MKTPILASILSFSAAFAIAPAVMAQNDKSPDRQPATEQPRPTAGREDADAAPTSESDFISKALQRGDAELKVAQLASTKAGDASVKEFAEMMVRDHTAANRELKTVADKLNIKPDETPNAKAEEKYRELSNKTGTAFDKAFVEIMAHCHQKNIAFYEAGKKVAKDSEVTAYIDKTIPVLKTHSTKIEGLKPGGDKAGETNPRPGPATDPAFPEKK